MSLDWSWRNAELNRHNAEMLGKAAKLAYSPKDKVVQDLNGMGWDLVKFFEYQDTQAYLARNKDALILAFRGTEPTVIPDWICDLDATQVKALGGQVHAGFLGAVESIWADIWNTVRRTRRDRSVWITGHSLGGALAVVATAKFLAAKQPVNGLYTFGQPRVGDAQFCRGFDLAFGPRTFRFVNYRDIVPRVPFPVMNYGDLGTFQYFSEQNWEPQKTWAEVLLDKLGDTLQELAKHDIQDHMMDNYLLKLNKLANVGGIPHQ